MLAITDTALIDPSLMVSHLNTKNKEWDVMKLEELVNNACLQLILVTPTPLHSISDFIC